LWFGDDGRGFIHAVNGIHSLPYLQAIEVLLLGVPIVVHAAWGIQRINMAKYNSFGNDGKHPYLPEYGRNRAYTWQRITSWVLVIGILAHVIHMRFYEYPTIAEKESQRYYMVRLDQDPGLATLGVRLDFSLYTPEQIQQLKEELLQGVSTSPPIAAQAEKQQKEFIHALEKRPLESHQVIAVAKDFGTAELLMVRETFKMPIMLVLYTLFVLSACYHGFNGLWTFLITWGVTLSTRSMAMMLKVSKVLMVIVTMLGLAAIWGTYWINLRY
jgi:succinate dehydrogenase / fumarate reductase cytochrome b subunit